MSWLGPASGRYRTGALHCACEHLGRRGARRLCSAAQPIFCRPDGIKELGSERISPNDSPDSTTFWIGSYKLTSSVEGAHARVSSIVSSVALDRKSFKKTNR